MNILRPSWLSTVMYVCMYIRLKQLTNRNIDNTDNCIIDSLVHGCCLWCNKMRKQRTSNNERTSTSIARRRHKALICHSIEAGIVYQRPSVCLSLCACETVRTKTEILLSRNWCNLLRICVTVNHRSDKISLTCDLDLRPWELFSYSWWIAYNLN